MHRHTSCRTPRPSKGHTTRGSRRPSANDGPRWRGGVQRTTNDRLTRRLIFGAMNGWWPKPGTRPTRRNWVHCLADDLRVFQATEGFTESSPLMFGVETTSWPGVAEKSGKWYRGVVEAADCFMARWHRDESQRSWLRHAAEDAKSRDERGGKGGAAVLIQLSTNAETK